MKIELNEKQAEAVADAVAAGRASDAGTYVAQLIEQDAADRWVTENQSAVESLLAGRMEQPGVVREERTAEAYHESIRELARQQRQRQA